MHQRELLPQTILFWTFLFNPHFNIRMQTKILKTFSDDSEILSELVYACVRWNSQAFFLKISCVFQVNGKTLLGLNHVEVVTILKELPQHVRIVCARRKAQTDLVYAQNSVQMTSLSSPDQP